MQFTAVQTIYIVTTVRLFIEVTEFKWSVSDIIKHLGISDSLMGSIYPCCGVYQELVLFITEL